MLAVKCITQISLLLVFIFPLMGFASQSNYARKHIELLSKQDVKIDFSGFVACYQHRCKKMQMVSLTSNEWSHIIAPWALNNKSSMQERALIAETISRLELIVGRMTNTQFDMGDTFPAFFTSRKTKSEQMDCVDESTNTLTYLRLLETHNKLRWHTVEGLITRAGLLAGYPHTAVLIKEKNSGEYYVVDSWFYDNARPPVISRKSQWKLGWKPKN